MATTLRMIAAFVAAMLVAFVLVVAVELFSAVVHPFPPDFDGTMEQMCAHVARYPSWVLAIVVPAWGFTAWLSTWIAKRVGGLGPAISVGILLIVAVLYNVSKLPYPLWFKIVMVIAILASVALGCQIKRSGT